MNLPQKKIKKGKEDVRHRGSNGICLKLPLPIFIQKINLHPPVYLAPLCHPPVFSARCPPTWMRSLLGVLHRLEAAAVPQK